MEDGLNVLSGETGVGKSIVIDALDVVLGGKVSPDIIRSGAERAIVQVAFEVAAGPSDVEEEWSPGDYGDVVVVTREVSHKGKSVFKINDRIVPASTVRKMAEKLVDIHGQHEHQSVLKPSVQLELLDRFVGEEALVLRRQIGAAYRDILATEREAARYPADEDYVRRHLDLLSHDISEIEAAKLRPGEEEQLLEERKVLANAEKLAEGVSRAYSVVYGGGNIQGSCTDSLGLALRILEEMARMDASLSQALGLLREAHVALAEGAFQLRQYLDQLVFDPGRLKDVESRLDLIYALKRKHGQRDIAGILRRREEMISEAEELKSRTQRISDLRKRRQALLEPALLWAEKLSRIRREAAAQLQAAISPELSALGMPHAALQMNLVPRADGIRVDKGDSQVFLGPDGMDAAELLARTNPGDPFRPLAKVASGGELSRFVLAFKSVLAFGDDVPTLVFDEIDTGIGGMTANAVAERLLKVARGRQVICVSHLPAIATAADAHFAVSKEIEKGRATAKIVRVEGERRVAEICRMLGDEAGSSSAREHALHLLRYWDNLRNALPRPESRAV